MAGLARNGRTVACCLALAASLGGVHRAQAQETLPTDPPREVPPPPADPPAPPPPVAPPPPAPRDEAPRPPAPRAFGYAATLGAVSLPRLLSLDFHVVVRRRDDPRWDRFAFGAGVEYLPSGIANFGSATMSWFQAGLDGMWFPWRWLFVGARLGWQSVKADSSKFGSDVHYTTTAFFAAPKVGVLYRFPSGFTVGGELGGTIPIGAGTTLESDGTEDSNGRKVSKTFGGFFMPFLTLFRAGYTF